MQVEWYGQPAFRLTDCATTVFIDPFDDLDRLATAASASGICGRAPGRQA
jgi:L-ascorbate metabolism protein UlaG (beta-lactamase superfamily)